MSTENKSKLPIALIMIFLVLLIGFILIYWKWGALGIGKVFNFFFWFVMIVGIIGFVFYIVYWLFFKKHKKDAVHILRQKIIRACMSSPQTISQELYFIGDDIRFMSKIGNVHGICRIQSSEKKEYKVDEKLKKELPISFEKSKVIYFITASKGFFSKLFGNYMVIGLFEEDILNKELSYPKIYVKDSLFSYEIFDILWCSKHFRETWTIDLSMKDNIYRSQLQEILKELPNIIDDAIDLSGKYRKDKEMTTAQSMGIQQTPKEE